MNIDEIKRQSKKGDHRAQALLSLAFFTGSDVPQDNELAKKWFEEASKDKAAIENALTVDAVAANSVASFYLYCYWKNMGSRDDAIRANLFLISAAKNDHAVAEKTLGSICRFGLHVPAEYHSVKQAEYWLLRSLKHGCRDAHRYLYALYSDSENLDILDYKKAFYHISQIIEDGSYTEAKAIGNYYASGHGVEKDLVKGAMWLFIAACQIPETEATDELNALRTQMSNDEFFQAEEAALEWIKKNGAKANDFREKMGLVHPVTLSALDIELDNANQTVAISNEEGESEHKQTRESIDQWHRYCADTTSVDKSDLYTLLFEDPKLNDAQLNEIFQYYDCRDELIERFKLVCDCRHGRTKKDVVVADVEAAVREDLLLKYRYCLASDSCADYEADLANLSAIHIKTAELKLVGSKEFQASTQDVLYEVFSEIISSQLPDNKILGYYGLSEALYGATQDNNLVNYVLAPFAESVFNYAPYIDVLKMGADYILTNDALLVYLNPRRKVVS